MTLRMTPVYSGYMSIWWEVSDLSVSSELPMLGFSLTVKPLASRAWAYMSPSVNSSVKFLSPMVIGGFPLPGFEPEPEDPEVEDPEVEDEELPHAASKATTTTTATVESARRKLDCIEVSPLADSIFFQWCS